MEATPPPTPPPPAPPAPPADYPVQFDVDYPDRDLNRATTFFRLFTVIPILIVLAAVGGESCTTVALRTGRSASAAGCCSCRSCC